MPWPRIASAASGWMLPWVLCVATPALVGCLSIGDGVDSTVGASSGRFADAVFSTTHNSYSGKERGALVDQLDAGVRLVELDVHDDDFARSGFRIGHDGPGDAVDHSGNNPNSNRLVDWLTVIADWSRDNPGHAPLVVVLDLKDSLADNASFAAGNLARLDHVLDRVLGERRAIAGAVKKRTALDQLRGRVLTVLSGDTNSRLHYLRDRGFNPAVAANNRGQVLELHDSGSGDLWYWSGRLAGGRVEWLHHGRFDAGRDPSVVMDERGRVVEVHVGRGGKKLYYRTGILSTGGELRWLAEPRQFPSGDEGKRPSLAIVATDPLVVREIHQSRSTGLRWTWTGRVGDSGEIDWTRPDGGRTDDARYQENTVQTALGRLSVWRAASNKLGSDVLRYRAPGGFVGYVRYRQRLFVEEQRGGPAAISAAAPRFVALEWDGSDRAEQFVEEALVTGRLVRLWGADRATWVPKVNYLASDEPYDEWYQRYLDDAGWVSY